MRKYLANMVTGIRIFAGIWLLSIPVFSLPFYIAYLLCGFTDMIDGTIARKTNSATRFGEKLDSVADLMFLAAAFLKLLPAIQIPRWLWIWISVIAILRIGNLICRAIQNKPFLPGHTVLNKLTGLLLFLLPLTFSFIEAAYSTTAVCIAATFASIDEVFPCYFSKKHDII